MNLIRHITGNCYLLSSEYPYDVAVLIISTSLQICQNSDTTTQETTPSSPSTSYLCPNKTDTAILSEGDGDKKKL